MPDFNLKQHQIQVFFQLKHIIQTQKIPNAFLFYGDENSKRSEAASFLAKGCNCLENSDGACNHCISCCKIDAKSHPDIIFIDLEKEKKIISISQIRKIELTIASRQNEARNRVVIILHADMMNHHAQNALLKMVEEPPEKTFFILVAQKINMFLPTIISRCQKIRFKPLTYKQIEQKLIADFKIDYQMAHIAARTADSNLKKAMMFLNLNLNETSDDHDWIQKRIILLKALSDIIIADTNICISKGLLLSQKISIDQVHFDNTIAVMKTFFRDLVVFKYNHEKIVNLDFSNTFNEINLIVKSFFFSKWLENLFETEKRIASNTTPRLVLDKFFLNIAKDKRNADI
jgi:DNA polymerase III subunit delta'